MGYVSSKSLRDSGSSVYVEIFTDGVDYTSGTTTQLTASNPLPAANAVWVYFDGVVQHHSEYGVSGYTITFSSAIPADTANVEVQFNKEVNVGIPGQNTITHSMMTSDNISTLLRKNAIINGNFDIWQRATSQTSSGYGSDDRWINYYVGSSTTFSRQSFTVGQTDVPNNPKYYSRSVVTSSAAAGNYSVKLQRIEDVRIFSGESITLSFWAKADATKNMAIEFSQRFGTGGSPSTQVDGIGAQHAALTTTWQKYVLTIDIPSITGKTLGTNDDHFLQLGFWFDAGTSYDTNTASLGQQSGTFDIAQVQIEKGSDATDFENRSFGEEYVLCQRYYQKSYDYGTAVGTATRAGSIGGRNYSAASRTVNAVPVKFPIKMRASPTVTVYSLNGTSGSISDAGASYAHAADLTLNGLQSTGSESGFSIVSSTAVDATDCFGFQYTADAEL